MTPPHSAPDRLEQIDAARRATSGDRARYQKLLNLAKRAVEAGINDPTLTSLLQINIQTDPMDARLLMTTIEERLQRLGMDLINRMMEQVEVSVIFQIVQEGQTHRKNLLNRTIDHPEFGEVHVGPELFKFLELNFSIGTPPITKKNLKHLREIMLGDRDPNEIREMAKIMDVDFEDLTELSERLNRIVVQSTHYTTSGEAHSHAKESHRFANMEGGRPLRETIVSGGADRAEELLTRYLFREARGSDQIQIRKVAEPLDALQGIKDNPDQMFVLRVKQLPSSTWQPGAWDDCLGRVVIIDDSEMAQRSNTCYVYSLLDDVIDGIDQFHTNLSGKLSSPQLGLREILEDFSPDKISKIKAAVDQEVERLEEATANVTYDNADREENGVFIKDLYTVRQLQKVLELLEDIANNDLEKVHEMSEAKRKEVGQKWMLYFYRRLQQQNYTAHVGNGGGREGLELVSRFRTRETQQAVETFVANDRARVEVALGKWGGRLGYQHRGTQLSGQNAEWDAESRAESRERSRRGLRARAKARVQHYTHQTRDAAAEKLLEKLGTSIADLSQNPSRAAALLSQLDERINKVIMNPDEDSDPRSPIGIAIARMGDRAGKAKLALLYQAHALVSQYAAVRIPHPEKAHAILDEVKRLRRLDGRLLMERVMWTYNNVMDERFFPPGLRIAMDLGENRQPDIQTLRQKLTEMKIVFREVPELFELLTKSMTIVINSPKNPDGTVYEEDTAVGILNVASEFDLTIIDDNSYYKVVTKRDGRRIRILPFAEIYEEHRDLFPNPVRVITVATSTKNLFGAGERVYNIVANDPDLTEFIEEKRGDAMPHTMALHLVAQKLDAGIGIKEVYKKLQSIERTLRLDQDITAIDRCIQMFEQELAPQSLMKLGLPHAAYQTITETYYLLCRLTGRGGTGKHAKEVIKKLLKDLKSMRPEKGLAEDVDKRFATAEAAIRRSTNSHREPISYIKPEGAFYICLKMDEFPELESGTQPLAPFLKLFNRHKGVGITPRGDTNFVRLSLGDMLDGNAASYEHMGLRIEIALRLLYKYWKLYNECGDLELFKLKMQEENQHLNRLLDEKQELLKKGQSTDIDVSPLSVKRGERDTVFQIEPTSNAVNIILENAACPTPEALLKARPFQLIFRFLLRNFRHEIPRIAEMSEQEVLARFTPQKILRLMNDEPIDPGDREILRQIMFTLNEKWFGARVRNHAIQVIDDDSPLIAKRKQLMGASEMIGQHLAGILLRLDHSWEGANGGVSHGFARGYQVYENIKPNENLPDFIQETIAGNQFVGVTATTNPHPSYNTEVNRRLGGRAFSFLKRGETPQEIAGIKQRIADYIPQLVASREFVCKAVQVGHTRQLMVIHKSALHFLHDECRLFPEIDDVCSKEGLNKSNYDAVLFFGLPKKLMGEHQMGGYIVDECKNGNKLPIGWVSGSNMTDYFGFVKKWLLTLHNEKTIEKGAVPVHGALFRLHYKDGDVKTIIASGDSATGKSELIAKFMEKMQKLGPKSPFEAIEILAGDMMSAHIGEDGNIYAIGTETGDFVRLDDLEDTEWEAENAHRLYFASRTNPDMDNRRATVPNICDVRGVLRPTKVDFIFSFNNYEDPGSGEAVREMGIRQAYELIAAGRRKNKKTSGDLPDFNTDVELSDRSQLAERINFNEILKWERTEDNRLYIGYRDGQHHWRDALKAIEAMFVGQDDITQVDYDPIKNRYDLVHKNGNRETLNFQVFIRYYEPIVATFMANVFGPTSKREEMTQNVDFLVTIAEAAGVVGGEILTQLTRNGMDQDGPERAADELMRLLSEPRFRKAIDDEKKTALSALRKKLGDQTIQPPIETITHNIRHKRMQYESNVVLTSGATTPHFSNVRRENTAVYNPDIVPPTVRDSIEGVLQRQPERSLYFNGLEPPRGLPANLEEYDHAELIYLIMLKRNPRIIDATETEILRNEEEIRKADHLSRMVRPIEPTPAPSSISEGFPEAHAS